MLVLPCVHVSQLVCHTLLDVLCNYNVAYVCHDNTLVVARITHCNFLRLTIFSKAVRC